MACHANINTTLVCSHDLDRVSQAGEFAVDGMLGESQSAQDDFRQ